MISYALGETVFLYEFILFYLVPSGKPSCNTLTRVMIFCILLQLIIYVELFSNSAFDSVFHD
jgi:hypothetical protein